MSNFAIFGNIKTAKDLATASLEVAKNYKTLYITGCFGWPMNDANKKRIKNEWAANRKEPRASNIDKASVDTFGFDCVNFFKALLWGWCGDVSKEYGGAKYQANGVPDVDEGTFFSYCSEQSTDFNEIEVGEMVWMQGHIGIYIGNGLVVECTPAWTNNVQITACNRTITGYNRRDWTKHGKLPYVTYTGKNDESIKPKTSEKRELHLGDTGEDVKALQEDLIELGYDLGKWGADGDFGSMTDEAVRTFQAKSKLEVDGWVGKNTHTAIELALAEHRKPKVEEKIYYRVRKSWDDPSSQVGAYLDVNGAIAHCKQMGSEYKVFDPNGTQVYPKKAFDPYLARVNVSALNVRKEPRNDAKIINILNGGAYTIVDENNGWGLLKAYSTNRDGWINLEFVSRI